MKTNGLEKLLFDAYRIVAELDTAKVNAGAYDVCGNETNEQVEVNE